MPKSSTLPDLTTLPDAPPGAPWPWTAPEQATPPGDAPWPRITIVTPSFNQAAYVEETLRSVLLQGYPNLEYLVMDGGSSDDSPAIIRRYEPWLTGWVSEPDGGQSQAINKGFARASGDILGWLNSDDIYLPGALLAAAAAFREHPSAVLVYGDARHIAPAGALINDQPCARPFDRRWLLEHSNLVPQPAAFFRTSAFRQAGGLDESLHYVMDWDLWLRLDRLGQAVFVPQVMAHMRIYPEAKFQAGGRRMHAELRSVIERHGGRGLPAASRQRLVERHLALAVEAFARGDGPAGQDELAYVLEHAPERRPDSQWLAQAIAERAWQMFLKQGAPPLPLAKLAGAHLPPAVAAPAQVRQRLLGLLHEALAFHHHRARRAAATRQHAWLAMRAEPRQWANRGLWSVGLRSLLPGGARKDTRKN